MDQSKEDVKEVQNIMLRTKTDIAQQVADMRGEMHKNTQSHDNVEMRMEQVIADAKFWLEKYTKGYKENDAQIGKM